MSWENILKRPFDVGEAQLTEMTRRASEQTRELRRLDEMLAQHVDQDLKGQIAAQPSDKRYAVKLTPEFSEYIRSLLATHRVDKANLEHRIAKLYPNIDNVIISFQGTPEIIFKQN